MTIWCKLCGGKRVAIKRVSDVIVEKYIFNSLESKPF